MLDALFSLVGAPRWPAAAEYLRDALGFQGKAPNHAFAGWNALLWTGAAAAAVPLLLVLRQLAANLRIIRRLHDAGIPEEKGVSVLLGHMLQHASMDYELCDHAIPLLQGDQNKLTWHHRGGKPIRNPMIFLRRFLLSTPQIFIADPKALHSIFVSNSYKFVKPNLGRQLIGSIVGHLGLVTVEHDVHRRHRRIVTPIFSMKNLKLLVPDFVKCLDDFCEHLIKQGDREALPFHEVASRATLSVLGRTAMGGDFEALSGRTPAADAFETLLEAGELNFTNIVRFQLPAFMQWPFNRKAARAFDNLNRIVRDIITRSRQGGGGNSLSQILVHSAETSELSEEELVCEVATFLGAGHETSSGVLTNTMLQLAFHPDVQERLYEEVTTKLADLADYDTLQRLPLLNHVLAETQRLYPTVYLTLREAFQDVDLPTSHFGTLRVQKGTQILIPIRAMHMMPHTWGADAAKWNPDRWDKLLAPGQSVASDDPSDADALGSAAKRTVDTWEYAPFMGGPRGCIGRQFAMMELRIYVAGLVRKFRMHSELSDRDIEVRAGVTAKPKNAFIRFSPRAGSTAK